MDRDPLLRGRPSARRRRLAPASGRALPVALAVGHPAPDALPAPKDHFRAIVMRAVVLRSAHRRTGLRAARVRLSHPAALKVSLRRVALKANVANAHRVAPKVNVANDLRVVSKANVANAHRAAPKANVASAHRAAPKANAVNAHRPGLKESAGNAPPAASRASAANDLRVASMANVASVPRAGWKAIAHPVAKMQNVTAASGRPVLRAMKVRVDLRSAAHADRMTLAVRAPRVPVDRLIRALVASALRGANATSRVIGARRSGHALARTVAPIRNAGPLIGPRETKAHVAPRQIHATSARTRRNAVPLNVASARSPSPSRRVTASALSARRGKIAMAARRLGESLVIGRRAGTVPPARVRPAPAIVLLAAALPSATALANRRGAPLRLPGQLAPKKRRRVRLNPSVSMTMRRALCACRS
jgi:hypothetical protein